MAKKTYQKVTSKHKIKISLWERIKKLFGF